MSPEPEINITHNTCNLCRLVLFAIRFIVKIRKAATFACFAIGKCECVCHSLQRMAKPVANASLRQTKATTGENKIKTVLCVTLIPDFHLPHQQAEACHALPLLLINDGLGSQIGLNIH